MMRQKQVPEPGGARLPLQLLHDGGHGPARLRLRELAFEDGLGGVDVLGDERRHALLEVFRSLGPLGSDARHSADLSGVGSRL